MAGIAGGGDLYPWFVACGEDEPVVADAAATAIELLQLTGRLLVRAIAPLARATALVDVLEALPRELRARKHEVGIAMPYYRELSENAALDLRDTVITLSEDHRSRLAAGTKPRHSRGRTRTRPRPITR